MNRVFVLDSTKTPLMPCSSARARILLSAGKAAVFRTVPFTIILKNRIGGDTQPIEFKVDPGSKTTGIALVATFKRGATMHEEKRGRIIEKLQRLADPSRNPNVEEVASASAKLEELLLQEKRDTEEMEFRVLFPLRKPPQKWKKGLFDFICKINACAAIYTITERGQHLFKAAGRPTYLKKAEMQYLWALKRIEASDKKLPEKTPPEYRESYIHGATRELVKLMKEVCIERDNTEAVTWLSQKIKIQKEADSTVEAIDPYWSAGRKAVRKNLQKEKGH